ncbi:Hint domain-containing protein [Tateyamaria sp. Alg231-49]|uniref:Hint domain-containing protein n=1 Tax=Tateyamaria sp. Alg231-49 TaxID=1922219 RepID=UPI001F1835E5|nr:Hint domain-containing protein [Tateyamaria sp. Alg231-49]
MTIPAPMRTRRAPSTPVMPTRSYNVAALNPDGTRFVHSFQAPMLPLFETAFSAFARGTTLAGPHGAIAIEDLVPGDWLNTSAGQPAEVTWIGSTTFVPAHAGRRMPLVRIMADSFGQSRPSSFVSLGKGARVLQTPPHLRGSTGGAQTLTPISDFVDGVNVIEVSPPTPVHLYHLCLTRHAAVDVGGMMVETFHPGMGGTRDMSYAQRDQFLSMFPRISHITDFGPLAHPRAPEAEEAA